MSQSITVTGMVLSASPMGEYDKRVVILTKERGKISAFAKGARRQNSPLLSASSPFVFGRFTMYEGRSSYTLWQAEVENYFAELRLDMEAAYYGFYFLEFADYYGREANNETQLLKLLYQSLRALSKRTMDLRLIRAIYELKIISINGESPQVFECVVCGGLVDDRAFSSRKGGLVCRTCKGGMADNILLHTSTLYALQFIISSSIEKLYTFQVQETILLQLEKVMKEYVVLHVENAFKSLEILENL